MIDRTMTRRVAGPMALLVAILLTTIPAAHAFTTMSPVHLHHPSASEVPLTQTNMFSLESSSLTLASPMLLSAFTSPEASMDPAVEAELFSDAAHIALDLTAFLGPAKLGVRLAAVIGRICSILSDYLPDHSMLPEEFVFQVCMLTVASMGFCSSLTPMLQASLMDASQQAEYKDRKCFASLLRPFGCSWMQYKILMSQKAFEWKTLQPNELLSTASEDENTLYWVYSGKAYQGDAIIKNGSLLGDLSLLMSNTSPNTKASAASKGKKSNPSVVETKTLRAGSDGATVVRIDSAKLQSLMNKDEGLDKAIRNLLLNTMQQKVAALTAAS